MTQGSSALAGPALHLVIAEFGPRRVLLAALFALLCPRAGAPLATQFCELDDHMRRDMGLPPRAASPPVMPAPVRCMW